MEVELETMRRLKRGVDGEVAIVQGQLGSALEDKKEVSADDDDYYDMVIIIVITIIIIIIIIIIIVVVIVKLWIVYDNLDNQFSNFVLSVNLLSH